MRYLLKASSLLLMPVCVASGQINFGAPLPSEPVIPPVCGKMSATAILPDAYLGLTSEGSTKDPIHLGPTLTVTGNSVYSSGTSPSCSAANLATTHRTLEECQARWDTAALNTLIGSTACSTGSNVAIEVSTSGSYNAIILNPVIFPAHVSLVVDSGMTIYGSSQAAAYSYTEDKDGGDTRNVMTNCGTWTTSDTNDCRPLLAFVGANSGIYGYGVIDGRGTVEVNYDPTYDDSGNKLVTVNVPTTDWTEPYSWYSLKDEEIPAGVAQDKTFNVFTPILVQTVNDNFTLYKITLRNSDYYHVQWSGEISAGGDSNYYPTGTPTLGYAPTADGYGTGTNIPDNFMAWGVKIAAPWNRGNTDGFNVTGENATIAYYDVGNGDDQISVEAYGSPSANYQIRYVNGYSKNGLSTGDSTEWGITHLDVEYANLTGDVPQYSAASSTINGRDLGYLTAFNSGLTLADALPTITGRINGLEIKNNDDRQAKTMDGSTPPPTGGLVSSIYYSNVCMQDINRAIDRDAQYEVAAGTPGVGGYYPSYVQDVEYRYIRVLPPTDELLDGPTVKMPSGSTAPYTYQLNWAGYAPISGNSLAEDYFTLDAVSFDNSEDSNPGGGAYYAFTINSQYNQQSGSTPYGITIANSYDPILLANMGTAYSSNGNLFRNNTETLLGDANPGGPLANVCNATVNSNFPFLNGEVFYVDSTLGGNSDHPSASTTLSDASSHLALEAIVQPSMAQEDLYLRYFATNPADFPDGLFAVGAPALSSGGAVTFQIWNSSGTQVSSCAAYNANSRRYGCAYSSLSPALAAGTYAVTATYAGDAVYPAYTFGSNMTPSGAPDTAGKYQITLPGSPSQTVFITPTLTINPNP